MDASTDAAQAQGLNHFRRLARATPQSFVSFNEVYARFAR
jgi:hypothetical protein